MEIVASRLLFGVSLLALGGTARAACEDWGQVSPEDRIVYLSETVTFYVVEGTDRSCGDVTQCDWTVDEGLGTLSATRGSPVDWTAPDSLADCLPLSLRIYVECPGVPVGSSLIDLRCTDEDLELLKASRGSTIAGGGCGTPPASAALLLPVLGLLGLRRARATTPRRSRRSSPSSR